MSTDAFRSTARRRLSDYLWSPSNRLKVSERAVGEIIARCFGKNDFAYPGRKYIADRTGLTTRTVSRAERVLVKGDPKREILPILTREVRRGADGRPRGFIFRLVNDPEALVAARQAKVLESEGTASPPQVLTEATMLAVTQITRLPMMPKRETCEDLKRRRAEHAQGVAELRQVIQGHCARQGGE